MFRRVAPVLVTLACLSTGVQAQPASLFRAYLSATGSDANPCTLAAPCRLLPAALNAVASGGEIWMLDSANYNTGTVTIGKSVSILSVPGAQGSIVLNNGHAIVVSAAGLRVALRNVAVVPVAGAGTFGQFGLFLFGNSAVTLDHCLFAGLPDDAVRVTEGRLIMTDTVVRDSAGGWGVNVASNSGAYVSIANSRLVSNGEGGVRFFSSGGEVRGAVTDSFIVGTKDVTSYGVQVGAIGQALTNKALVTVSRSTIESHTYGVSSEGPPTDSAILVIQGNAINHNSWGYRIAGSGKILTYGGNGLYNSTDGTGGTLTVSGGPL